MSAAAFVLAINLFIAGTFATAFGIVAARYREASGARWLSLAYSLGIANGLLEFLLRHQTDARPLAWGIFAAFLIGLTLSLIGLARHYRVRPPWLTLGVIVPLSLIVNAMTLDMPRDSLLRGLLYQLPYALVSLAGIIVVLRLEKRRALDLAQLVLFAVSAANFLGKPFLAQYLGSGGSPQGYLHSTYAAISQSMGAALLITNGLLMLLIIVRDMMADVTMRSETDSLSGLLNRRGFEDQADTALSAVMRSGVPAALVIADLDNFKQINDNYGHAAGDRVIAAFGRILADCADKNAIIARLGGEEFVAFLPAASRASARHFAEMARLTLGSLPQDRLGVDRRVTSSFGIAIVERGDTLSNALRRADAALYAAKTGGRNQVHIWQAPSSDLPISEDQSDQKADEAS